MKLFYALLMIVSSISFATEKEPQKKTYLQIKKGGQIEEKKIKIPLFYLQAKGLTKGENFKLIHCNAHGRLITVLEGTYLGEGIIKKTFSKAASSWGFLGKSLETFEPIWIGGFAQGEASEFHLIDSKGNSIDKVSYLPNPIEEEAADGAKVSMSYCGKNIYQLEGEHFTPGEQVDLTSLSRGETITGSHVIDSDGKFFWILLANEDTSEAQSLITIKRKKHSLSINYTSSSASIPLSPDNPMLIFTIDHLPSNQEMEVAKLCQKLLLLQM